MIYFKVTDDEMINDRIANGDIVLIKLQEETSPNDISCIIQKSDLVLRKVERREHKYILTSSSSDPMECENIVIIGKVIHSTRKI